MAEEIYSVYVWGQHTSKAGLRAWPDLEDENEDMNDYEHFSGSAEGLQELAAWQRETGTEFGNRVAAILEEEIA